MFLLYFTDKGDSETSESDSRSSENSNEKKKSNLELLIFVDSKCKL